MKRLTHEADFGLEDWEETLFLVESDPSGAYNILDIARYHGEPEFDTILKNIVLRLAAIEDILGDEYELNDLEKALWCKKVVADAFSDNPEATERLRELWFADKDGRCVVFSPGYPVVSTYHKDESGRIIREVAGAVTVEEYEAALKAREQDEH